MSFELSEVVPWGRSFEEYLKMFSLNENDLTKCILGCGDGPASFNAELSEKGGNVISVDPVYNLSVEQLQKRIDLTAETVAFQVAENRSEFVWGNDFFSPEDLLKKRLQTMALFLDDFEDGKEQGRYLAEELPVLSFPRESFDLILVSHFLFLYSEILSLDFHISSILNLLDLAPELRIFPVVELNGSVSRHLDACISELVGCGIDVSTEVVEYEFQKGGNQMMVIQR
jgi:SAM-dependent methyltransferase